MWSVPVQSHSQSRPCLKSDGVKRLVALPLSRLSRFETVFRKQSIHGITSGVHRLYAHTE